MILQACNNRCRCMFCERCGTKFVGPLFHYGVAERFTTTLCDTHVSEKIQEDK